jgi:glycosyltransferase involved in cell wall biosynthesis
LWGFSQCDRTVCSADAYWDLLVDGGVPERRLTYLPWGLPLEQLPLRKARAAQADAPVLGFVGRIEPRKGQLALVQAFARLQAQRPGAKLELVGPLADAAYAAELRTAIRRAGLSRSVTLTGPVPDVAARMKEWDLFVSMSSDEGQGLAVLEAMAIGVPVAARPVAGIVDFLSDGRTGFAINSTRANAVTATLRSALASPRLAVIARNARRMVERQYDWTATVKAFDALYRR